MIASMISMMRCRAESAPMVMSVPQKSLSMDPTNPTMFRWPCCCATLSVILPGGDNVLFCLLNMNKLASTRFSDLTFFHKFSQQAAPLVSEDVGPGEAAVSAAHTQVGDAFIHQVEGGGQATLAGCEGFATGAADYSSALQPFHDNKKKSNNYRLVTLLTMRPPALIWTHQLDNIGHTVPVRQFDVVPSINQPLVALKKTQKTIL